MAVLLEVSYIDAQGETSTNEFTVADLQAADFVLPKLKKLTNCKIIGARLIQPVNISTLANNTATAANVESAKFKMAISMTGPFAVGATAAPSVTLQIPAPVGTYVNGLSGDPTNADITTLLAEVLSNRGEPLDTVRRVSYVR